MSDFPFDIPTVQPSSGGGGLPFGAFETQDNTIYSNVPDDATGILLTSFEILITPTSATQKVYLSGVINGEGGATPQNLGIIIFRNGSSLAPTSGGTNNRKVNGQFLINFGNINENLTTPESCPFSYMDEPETTSELKYELHIVSANGANTFYLNRPVTGANSSYAKRLTSSFSAQCFEP